MKFLLSVVAVVAVAAGFSLIFAADADAGGCLTGWRCNAAVLVPAPNSDSLTAPPPAARRRGGAMCCALRGRAGCRRASALRRTVRLAAGTDRVPLPGAELLRLLQAAGLCGRMRSQHLQHLWRRDCWYDSFGRRFCNY